MGVEKIREREGKLEGNKKPYDVSEERVIGICLGHEQVDGCQECAEVDGWFPRALRGRERE